MTPKIVAALVAVFVYLAGNPASALRCYQCTITPPGLHSNETSRLCAEFDYTDRFVVECPYSTMCMKKTIQSPMLKKEAILRDCAAQKRDFQKYENGKWHKEFEVEEAYEEGCQVQDDKGVRTLTPEYCYCRRNLCNSARSNDRNDLSYHTDAMAVIFVFNAMKYFRSME